MADLPPPRPAVPARRVHDPGRHPRLARELQTIRAMVRIHCRAWHAARGDLCAACTALLDYATRRLDRCVFGDDKPTCANCRVHCYSSAMREQVGAVMRYAGPRMIWRHPILALVHLRDGRRPAPELPAPNRSRAASMPVPAQGGAARETGPGST